MTVYYSFIIDERKLYICPHITKKSRVFWPRGHIKLQPVFFKFKRDKVNCFSCVFSSPSLYFQEIDPKLFFCRSHYFFKNWVHSLCSYFEIIHNADLWYIMSKRILGFVTKGSCQVKKNLKTREKLGLASTTTNNNTKKTKKTQNFKKKKKKSELGL